MYAPLYRQMTLGTYYGDEPWEASPFFETAYEDIVDAFDHYMRNHNRGRDFVLIGHSQGAHLLTRLLEERFESDEAPFAPLGLQEHQTQALETQLIAPPSEGAGLHWSNFFLTIADLIRIVEAQTATRD
ncbi:MAG: DUF3089 domain-containing protein [Deltaproteobacteria bacterium]|nr:DUF3089 domain-containing protein [Deltaproteobacteria bacterium]NND28961.1 DUF3089 domain-containing protein [Myxococcales bacterium]MBT8463311.1 DUF3089 domain-containing protein [Deltaproteobacteria bacterium]MBT8481645.1 DUF3089 domain-containing protein [Deltaproteobacteria bacterium]NNK09008.1 DUF3089 domain-containing protein [Myxococcales bacterium]